LSTPLEWLKLSSGSFNTAKMEQQSSEWHKFRALGIGSSDVAAILGLSKWMTPYQLWTYKTGLAVQPDISGQYQVRRGIDNEAKARAHVELIRGETYEPSLAVHPKYDFMRVSLDGRTKSGERLCEIKVPSQKIIDDALKGIVPDQYMAQCQYQLMVTGALENLFFCFNPETNQGASVTVLPCKDWFSKIEAAVVPFWTVNVLQKIPPELTDRDYVKVTDHEMIAKATLYSELKKKLKADEEAIELLEEELKKMTQSHPAILCGPAKITRYTQKGAVEYAKIPELKNLDLEQYRKQPSSRVRITIEKD